MLKTLADFCTDQALLTARVGFAHFCVSVVALLPDQLLIDDFGPLSTDIAKECLHIVG